MRPLAPKDRAAACEHAFQNGGPRVYIFDAAGRQTPCGLSAARAARCAVQGEQVLARQKRGGHYEWIDVTKDQA